jgi:outer membrane protein OmpA-like peptidoglycan-associated protein
MKLRVISISLLLVVLALPGFTEARQASSNPRATAGQAAPVSQSADTTLEPLSPPTSQDFWDGEPPNLVNLIRHPFATKAYIKRHTEPIRDRLSELNELTASNAAQIKDIDARAQRGIQLSSDKANLADQHAAEAGNKAQVAKVSATEATTRVAAAEQRIGSLDQYKPAAQTEIRFSRGQSQLSKEAKDALDQMATPLKDQHNYVVEVQGYSAGRGQSAIAASQKMADSVVRYLVLNHKIPIYRIYALGMGDAAASAEVGSTARPAHAGRVEVNLMKNNQ